MKLIISIFLLAILATGNSNAQKVYASSGNEKSTDLGSDALMGTWAPEDNAFHVQIERIGNKYYGKLVWLDRPNNADGTPKKDVYNPDPSLRSMPFMGLRTLRDMEYKGTNIWSGGTIYDPESGKTYDCRIVLNNSNQAEIRGYMGVVILGKTVLFHRVK